MTSKVIPYPTTQINTEQVCGICLNDFTTPNPTPDQRPVTHTKSDGLSPVQHDPFHRGCLKEWAQNNPICPIDRTPLTPSSYPFISRFIIPGVVLLASMATGAVINRFISNPTMLPVHALTAGAIQGIFPEYKQLHLDARFLIIFDLINCARIACAPDLFCKYTMPYFINSVVSWAGREPVFDQDYLADYCTTMQSPLPYICGVLASWAIAKVLRRFLWSREFQ